jgi:hypothetical protein
MNGAYKRVARADCIGSLGANSVLSPAPYNKKWLKRIPGKEPSTTRRYSFNREVIPAKTLEDECLSEGKCIIIWYDLLTHEIFSLLWKISIGNVIDSLAEGRTKMGRVPILKLFAFVN